jgi:hypothetical protein
MNVKDRGGLCFGAKAGGKEWCTDKSVASQAAWAFNCHNLASKVLSTLINSGVKQYSLLYSKYLRPFCTGSDYSGNNAMYPQWLLLNQKESFRFVAESYTAACRKTDNLYTKRKAEGVLKDRVELPQCAAMRSLGTVVPIQADSTEACEKLNGCAMEDCNFDKKNRTKQCSFTKCYHAVPQKPCTLYSRVKSCATSASKTQSVMCATSGRRHCNKCMNLHSWGLPKSWMKPRKHQHNMFLDCAECYNLCHKDSCWTRASGCNNLPPWENSAQCKPGIAPRPKEDAFLDLLDPADRGTVNNLQWGGGASC